MLVPILALALTVDSKVGYGSELYDDCKAYLSYTKPGQPHSGEDAYHAEHCTAYMTGFLDGGSSKAGFCPHGHPVGFYVQMYVDFMDSHPGLMESPAPKGLTAMLLQGFPCPATE